ncbi:hypothetical protein HDV02_005142, partial [Globomyces sp. JEL0801]
MNHSYRSKLNHSLLCQSTEVISTVVMNTRNISSELDSSKKLPRVSPDKPHTNSTVEVDPCSTIFDESNVALDSVMLGSKRVIIDQLLDGRKALVDLSSQSKISQPKNYLYFRNCGFFEKLKSGGVDQNNLMREDSDTDLDYSDLTVQNRGLKSKNDDSTIYSSDETI